MLTVTDGSGRAAKILSFIMWMTCIAIRWKWGGYRGDGAHSRFSSSLSSLLVLTLDNSAHPVFKLICSCPHPPPLCQLATRHHSCDHQCSRPSPYLNLSMQTEEQNTGTRLRHMQTAWKCGKETVNPKPTEQWPEFWHYSAARVSLFTGVDYWTHLKCYKMPFSV